MRAPATRPLARRVLPAVVVTAALLAGCAATGAASQPLTPQVSAGNPELATDPGVPVIEDLRYGLVDGTPLLLDACLPPDEDAATPTPAVADHARPSIVVIHGGSWTQGDKASVGWRAVCQWLARSGYPAFAVDYRLVPQAVYPAQIDDVRAAVTWLRQPAQLRRFDLDPDRIAVFGGSAGGHLAALLGTTTDTGPASARVAAVVDLSGPVDLTGVAVTDDFVPLQLAFLGCPAFDGCATARPASPQYQVDDGAPPFFVAHSTDEKIPLEQSEAFVAELRDAGVDTEFVTIEGTLHSIAMLDADLKRRIIAFYTRVLQPD